MVKVTLITGASSGFGEEFAKLFAKKGHNLVITARSEGKLLALKKKLEEEYSVKVYVCPMDLAEKGAAHRIFDYTKNENLCVDILINNAGFGDFGRFVESDLKKQTDMVQVNVTALMELTHLFARPMVKNGYGKILNVASIAAFQSGPLMSIYYSTKAFVLSFTEALSVELKNTGVTVTALCPGPSVTGFEASANLANSGLFKNIKPMTAQLITEYGYKKLFRESVIAIPGFGNKLVVWGSKLAPRALVREVVYRIQK